MFSIERNFIIVFLVVFLKIDQGIYCAATDDLFTRLVTLRQPYTGIFGSNGQYTSRSNSISRDNITERKQLSKQYSFSSVPNIFQVTYEVPLYARTFQLIVSMEQYNSYTRQNDHMIVFFSSTYNGTNCDKTKNALWDLRSKEKYKNIKIYEVLKDYSMFISQNCGVTTAPTLHFYRGGFSVFTAEGEDASNIINIENLFKKLLKLDDKDEDKTKKASENTTNEDTTKKASENTTSNETKKLTEPKRVTFFYVITSLEQYKKYSQGIDYSIVLFCSQDTAGHKENCDAIKFILENLSNKTVYEKIKIFSVDKNDCEDVAKHFEIDSVPSLVSLCMEKVVDTLGYDSIQDSNADKKIESLFKSLLESKVQADWASAPRKIDSIYSLTNVEQYEKHCTKIERKIIFFFTSDAIEKDANEDVKKHLKRLIAEPIYSEIKVYGVDIQSSVELAKHLKVESVPALRSYLQNKAIYSLASNYAQQYTFVQNMFSNLITSYVIPEPVIKYSICGECAPKVGATAINQTDTNKSYKLSNLPPLKKEGILYTVSNKEEYFTYVVNTEFAVIDFGRKECTGCGFTYSKLEKLMTNVQKNQEIILYSIDIDACKDVAKIYDISVAPTLVFLRMGAQIEKFGPAKAQNEFEIQKIFNILLNIECSK